MILDISDAEYKNLYEIKNNIPPAVSMNDYIEASMKQYFTMLDNQELEESAYQRFFEENPSFIPGAFEVIGISGHDAYMCALISQPRIGKEPLRVPDFMWLANDSLNFCPVFIEIEKPTKVQFRKDNVPNARFNQALDQITEWEALLDDPKNRNLFYDTFSIPARLRRKAFRPQYVLIYGRRGEFESDDFKRNKRSNMQSPDTVIMSFDRLHPDSNAYNTVSAQVRDGKYYVKHIPPTFVYEPNRAEYLHKLLGFKDRIKDIKMISEERRSFLLERYDYWDEFGRQSFHGIFNAADRE